MNTNKRLFIKTWIAALRSGQYKQGHSKLVTIRADGEKDEYCCLGVALCLLGVGQSDILREADDSAPNALYNDIHNAIPNLKHLEEMGLSRDEAVSLAELNDTPVTFLEIADRLERKLEKDDQNWLMPVELENEREYDPGPEYDNE